MVKIANEKFKTYKNVFDEHTLRLLFKLSSQGHFEELKSPISIGKESNVFSATKKDGSLVVVKIYRTSVCDFKRMYNYISNDIRFIGLGKNRRKIVFAWGRREFQNLLRAREAGVRVPTPFAILDNVLVMELVGDKEPAKKLKDQYPNNIREFYKKLINNLKLLYKNAKLVHGDLSEYNILNFNENPVLIDLSHATPLNCANAEELLKKDINNIINFFRKTGLELNREEVLNEIQI